jgi:Mrp family chromosome partitioning ATPase
MSTHCESFVPLKQVEPGKSPAAAKVPMRSATVGGHDDRFFHLDLPRSLQLYRSLFSGILLAGVAVAAAYVLIIWPNAESLDLQSSLVRILRNVMVLAASTLLAAVAAATARYNLDRRVYIAADVERVLGFGPLAELPDFGQVSGGAGEESVLRLAGIIEHNSRHGDFRSCMFTGATAGVGVTTLAARAKSLLEGMGRTTVLVDATGSAHDLPGAASGKRGNRSSVLLKQMAEEMESETIVLTDTAPLLASAESEYLARFVDSAIVVIQSGVTTRAELREIARTLQRLEVPVVGFVLNRVTIEKANPSFRHSIRAVEQRLALQDRLCARDLSRGGTSAEYERQIVQEPMVVTKSEPVKPPVAAQSPAASPEPVASFGSGVTPSAAAQTEPVAVVSEGPAPATVPRTTRGRGEPARPGSEPKISKPDAAAPKQAPQPAKPVAAAHPSAAEAAEAAQPGPSAPEAWAAPLAPPPPVQVNMEPSRAEVAMEREEPGYTTASRLGGIRNLLVSLGRRSLKDAECAGEESDIEPRFERATVRPAYADAEVPPGDIDSAAADSSAVRVTAQPQFIRPKAMPEVEKEKEPVRPTAPPPRRDSKEAQDDIQTLPSWRGQYRKKRYPPI